MAAGLRFVSASVAAASAARQRDAHGRADAARAANSNAPAVGVHNLLHQRETEPCSAGGSRSAAIAAEEGLEHMRQVGAPDTDAMIDDLDPNEIRTVLVNDEPQ
jgi:hypothetical protein